MARIKTTGRELKLFWANEDPEFWPEEAHIDGMWWRVNGAEKDDIDPHELADTDIVEAEGAILYPLQDTDKDFAGVMKKWRKQFTHNTLVIELPAEHKDALAAFLKGLKGKIIQ
jgi:hypothetical protein